MHQTAIIPYQAKLRGVVMERGWTVEQDAVFQKHLWFLTIWTLRSVWAPAGLQLFLTFEWDDAFYSVGVSLEEPQDHHETHWHRRLYLKRGWEHDLPPFLDDLDTLRNTLAQ